MKLQLLFIPDREQVLYFPGCNGCDKAGLSAPSSAVLSWQLGQLPGMIPCEPWGSCPQDITAATGWGTNQDQLWHSKPNHVLPHGADRSSDTEVSFVSSLGRQGWAKDYVVFKFFFNKMHSNISECWGHRGTSGAEQSSGSPSASSTLSQHSTASHWTPAALPRAGCPRGSTTLSPGRL